MSGRELSSNAISLLTPNKITGVTISKTNYCNAMVVTHLTKHEFLTFLFPSQATQRLILINISHMLTGTESCDATGFLGNHQTNQFIFTSSAKDHLHFWQHL